MAKIGLVEQAIEKWCFWRFSTTRKFVFAENAQKTGFFGT
jgi:hypothetical protein